MDAIANIDFQKKVNQLQKETLETEIKNGESKSSILPDTTDHDPSLTEEPSTPSVSITNQESTKEVTEVNTETTTGKKKRRRRRKKKKKAAKEEAKSATLGKFWAQASSYGHNPNECLTGFFIDQSESKTESQAVDEPAKTEEKSSSPPKSFKRLDYVEERIREDLMCKPEAFESKVQKFEGNITHCFASKAAKKKVKKHKKKIIPNIGVRWHKYLEKKLAQFLTG